MACASRFEHWGIKFAATYIGEALENSSGGLKRGSVYEGRLNLAVDDVFEKLAGMRALTFMPTCSISTAAVFPRCAPELHGCQRLPSLIRGDGNCHHESRRRGAQGWRKISYRGLRNIVCICRHHTPHGKPNSRLDWDLVERLAQLRVGRLLKHGRSPRLSRSPNRSVCLAKDRARWDRVLSRRYKKSPRFRRGFTGAFQFGYLAQSSPFNTSRALSLIPPTVLEISTFSLVGLTLGFGLGVASYLTNGFLDRAFCLFGGTFNAVFVHTTLLCELEQSAST